MLATMFSKVFVLCHHTSISTTILQHLIWTILEGRVRERQLTHLEFEYEMLHTNLR